MGELINQFQYRKIAGIIRKVANGRRRIDVAGIELPDVRKVFSTPSYRHVTIGFLTMHFGIRTTYDDRRT